MAREACVVQLIPALQSGGAEREAVDIALAAAAAGLRSLVISAGGALVSELEAGGAVHIRMRIGVKNPLAIRLNAHRLAGIIRREGVSVLHARSRVPAWAGWQARKAGARFVTTFHGAYDDKGPLRHAYNSVMARGERVIAISQFIHDLVKQRYRVPDSRLVLIDRGIDLARFAAGDVDDSRRAALRQTWRLPANAPMVLLPARLTRIKGHAELLRALARLRYTNAVAVLAGQAKARGGYARELAELARELGIAERVRFTGVCTDMPAAYTLADVVACPSLVPEAFGRTVAEAIALGAPVVASGHGGAKEIITRCGGGFLYEPGHGDALAAALDRALDLDAERRANLMQPARSLVEKNYSLAQMQEKTLAVYRELL